MMDPDSLFAAEVESVEPVADALTTRRVVNAVLREYADLVRDPERLGVVDAELDALDAAESAFRSGIQAESHGYYASAAEHLEVAAEALVGDATLRLARCLVLLGRHEDALRWCPIAEAEGFSEAADLAVQCHAALGQPTPSRPRHDNDAADALAVIHDAEPASGPWTQGSEGADPGLTRRLKALACTAPLHDLDSRKANLDWLEPGAYLMSEIGLRIIDLVTIAMDFDKGAGHDEIITRTVPFIANQAPARPASEHERVARWVLERLINVGTVDRTFYQVYGEIDIDGRYQRQPFYFKLIKEVPGQAGSIALRASNEAITVLIGALDTDVESAQIAAEVKLRNLIDRGKLADARSAAEQARYRTVQYGEILRRRLEATRHDLRLVDWTEELPSMLDGALKHIEGRVQVEQAIHASITDARDTTEEPIRKRHAAELVAVVEDCLRRHLQLQARLQGARAVFRSEQDRQEFSGPPVRDAINLHGQLLEPLLEQPVRDAAGPLNTFFRIVAGLNPPEVPTLSSLVASLLRPVPDNHRTAGTVVQPTLDVLPDTSRFTNVHWQMSEALLDLSGRVELLSDLVAEAAEYDDHLPALVALRAGHALAPAVESARTHGQHHILVAIPRGKTFSSPRDIATGDDLLLTTADLVEDARRSEIGAPNAMGESA